MNLPARRAIIAGALFGAAGLFNAGAAFAQAKDGDAFPSRPVRMIVPFAPGGPTDIVARLLGQRLGDLWGQTVLIDNRAGAGGNLGVEIAARAAPDGYTVLVTSSSYVVNPALYEKLRWDPFKSFVPVTNAATSPNLFVVHPSVPAKSMKELVALARARPGALNYASAGNGSASHLAVEYFKLLTNTDIVAISYRGTGPMLVDMLAGHTLLTITGVPPLAPYVESGRLRGIAVGSTSRLPRYPKLPTVAESGYPEYEVTTWYGLLAPAKTPRETILQINAELSKMLARADVRETLAQQAAEPMGSTPEAFGAHIQREIARWARVIKAAGVPIE